MINRPQMCHAIRLAVLSSAIAITLVGCQPATDTAVISTNENGVNIDNSPAKHDGHGHQDTEHNEGAAELEHSKHDHSGHDHASKSTAFDCQPKATIGVYYHNDSTPQTAHLLIDDIEYDLTAVAQSETSKPTYISDIGLDDTHGIIWQVDGHHATLHNKTIENNTPIKKETAIEKEALLFDCQQAAE